MDTIKVQQVRSQIRRPKVQKLTLKAMGLKKVNQVVELPDNPCTRGMIKAVWHLVKVVE